MKGATSERAWHIRMARTFLAQAMAVRPFPQHSGWHATLLTWAANRRLKAAAIMPDIPAIEPAKPVQGELF